MKNNALRLIKPMLLVSIFIFVHAGQLQAALVVNPARPITAMVTVNPIIVSDNDGANTATFFGDASQQTTIEEFIDTIWAQAGIDVNFLAPTSWNNTFANWGSGGPPDNGGNSRPSSDLNTIIGDADAAGIVHPNPSVINMFFVHIPAGFSLLGQNSAAGLAKLDGNGITQFVGSNLLSFPAGREGIASVVAHEIGHNLGLPHITESENLMQSAGSSNPGERLNADQIQTALSSPLSVPVSVPVPAALWLFASGLLVLIRFRSRERLI